MVDAARRVFGDVPSHFIPAHPIAGSEQSGVLAGKSRFICKGHKVIITPLAHSDKQATKIQQLWQAAGADVLTMTVERHDEVLAKTSHLPHF